MKRILTLALAAMMLLAVCVSAQAATATQTGTGVTVVKAADWAATYPEIYASYEKNAENSEVFDHVEEYPMIATVYEGMAFNKFYNSARGHYYTVQDVTNTGRPHALANCFTCKTPDFTAKVNNEGVSA
ncbi:MAG: ammonia-forming cytochrome c nitrite reductase subunit c552 [Clostridia bacterium]|nr:ammonia-forming cytochrome c nitrite reductase subunit c552 [Clostridia bacterium]